MKAAGPKRFILRLLYLWAVGTSWALLVWGGPDRSVVNEWGRSHDVKNLFVVDGSVFVTSAGVNPTRTIQALALYVGDRIKKRLANLFD